MKRLLTTGVLLMALFSSLRAGSVSTNFPLAESPISEGGRWINGRAVGLDWSDVATRPGLAFGTQTGSGGYNDSMAVLSGAWGPDQTATATVHSIDQVGGDLYQEVELLLRVTLTPHNVTGYEINFRALNDAASYTEIVRWNGPLGNFTYLGRRSGSAYGIKDGDVVKASIVGTTITSYINDIPVLSVTDSTYGSGSPGMGFFLRGRGINSNYGFTSFGAFDGNTPHAPANLRILR